MYTHNPKWTREREREENDFMYLIRLMAASVVSRQEKKMKIVFLFS
jgi:hypothetical protein